MNIAISISQSKSTKYNRLPVVLSGLSAYKQDENIRFMIADMPSDSQHSESVQKSIIASALLNPSAKIDALMFIDDNIIFTPEQAAMIAFNLRNGKPVVSAKYVKSNGDINGAILDSESEKPYMVKEVGMGFTAIHRRVFEKMASKMPNCNLVGDTVKMFPFFMPFIKKSYVALFKNAHYYLDNESAFCARVIDCGFDIWIDPAIRIGAIRDESCFVSSIIPSAKDVAVEKVNTSDK